MENNYTVSLEGIMKQFSGVTVLDNVNFQLEKGVVHALVGGNGAGKSTLMKIMTGVYAADGGVIRVNGVETKIRNPIDAQSKGIRMIFQELSLSPTLTVMENIFLAQEDKKLFALDKKKMKLRTHQLLNELGIAAHPDDVIQDLDVGICQLIEIAKALLTECSVLVMDEPTSSLTERETDTLFRFIANLKKKGVSIIYISHRMKEIFQIADKIAVLRDGKIVADKNKDEFTMASLIDAMIGKQTEKAMEYKPREVPVSNEVMLEIKNLNVGERVKDISFSVYKGEILGLAGLMGSGRTEVLETLAGIRPQLDAKFILDGHEIKIRHVRDAIDRGIVLIPEDRRRQGLVLMHKVNENIILPNLKKVVNHFSISRKKVNELSNECVKELGIKTASTGITISSLSGGNQQKVVLSKWLKTDPRIMLLDEPTAGVDVSSKAEIIDIIRNFVAQNRSVIFVSSELSELMAVCDRVLVFSSGRIRAQYSREDIENEEKLQHAIQH